METLPDLVTYFIHQNKSGKIIKTRKIQIWNPDKNGKKMNGDRGGEENVNRSDFEIRKKLRSESK